jgi:hypothetical protein
MLNHEIHKMILPLKERTEVQRAKIDYDRGM